MKNIFLISCIIILGACGELTKERMTSDGQFKEYVAKFDKLFFEKNGYHNLGVIINFKNIDDGGHCFKYPDGSNEIFIDPQVWDRADEMEKQYLVFHEMGHCILGREHLDSVDADGWAVSIMHSQLDYIDFSEEKETYYLNELFNN